MLIRDRFFQVSEYTWKADKNGVKHYAAIQGIKLFTLTDSGDKGTSGGGSILARHFLEKEKWKIHFKEIYGEKTYSEIYNAVKHEYEQYLSNPTAYNKARQNRSSSMMR